MSLGNIQLSNHFLKRAFIVTPLLMGGCGFIQKSPVPGADVNTLETQHVTISTMLAATKCQIGRASLRIEALKEGRDADNPSAQAFNLQSGKGVLSAKTQIAAGNGAGIGSIVIPFSGTDGTTITPTFGGSLNATSVQQTDFAFSVSPEVKPKDRVPIPPAEQKELGPKSHPVVCDSLVDVEIGSALEDAVVAAYNEAVSGPRTSNGKTYSPGLRTKEIKITTGFTVGKASSAGFSSKIVFGAPASISSIGPNVSNSYTATDVNTLVVTLPLDLPNTDAGRRLIYCQAGDAGDGHYCIEGPFSPKSLKILRDRLNEASGTQPPAQLSPFSQDPSTGIEEPSPKPKELLGPLDGVGPEF